MSLSAAASTGGHTDQGNGGAGQAAHGRPEEGRAEPGHAESGHTGLGRAWPAQDEPGHTGSSHTAPGDTRADRDLPGHVETGGTEPVGQSPHPEVVAWFGRAASFLHRQELACPIHGVAHTGKLARAIVLDLALLDATGNDAFWQQAVQRAEYVVSRLAPDPEHGALVYFPGRLDPRNCSNSVIDSGECTDALSRLLLHHRATDLLSSPRQAILDAVTANAGSYLQDAVVEKEITNQRLWGAMGLASAFRLTGQASWSAALRGSLQRSLAEQLPDGAWGYQPSAERDGAFRGAADVTLYYHSRCLAFILHVLDAVPDLWNTPGVHDGVVRALEFLSAVITPDGLKPLALEGKRWFWDGSYEVGSNAYDIFALLRGAERFGVPRWRHQASQGWAQLWRHQLANGSIQACLERGRHDFVCPDFHTADLAWTAQALASLLPPSSVESSGAPNTPESRNAARVTGAGPAQTASRMPGEVDIASRQPTRAPLIFPASGIVRLENELAVALFRVAKQPRNTQFGGAIGGGALAYLGSHRDPACRIVVAREAVVVEGSCSLYPLRADRKAGLKRFLRHNPAGREGRQWLYVARLLARQRRWSAAASRLWRGYLRPLLGSVGAISGQGEIAAAHHALTSEFQTTHDTFKAVVRPAREEGTVPGWAGQARLERRYRLDGETLRVEELLQGTNDPAGNGCGRAVYTLPSGARESQVDGSQAIRRHGQTVEMRPGDGGYWLRVAYTL